MPCLLRLKKVFLITVLSSLQVSQCYPSYFFRYPKIEHISNQAYLWAPRLLSTQLFYPEMQLMLVPGAAIRCMRSKAALSGITVRLVIRSLAAYKYSVAPKRHFSLALTTRLLINQSWNSGWHTNNPNKNVMCTTSGPAFETRTNAIANSSNHLQPLIEGVRTATITSAEIAAEQNAIAAQLTPLSALGVGLPQITNDIATLLPYAGSVDISTTGTSFKVKTFLE